MNMCLKIFICLSIFGNIVIFGEKLKDLPKNFPKCARDKNLDTCWIKATDQVRPFLRKGVPELGIPSIEPLIIPEVTLEQGTDALNIKAIVKNIKASGLSNYNFTNFHFDLKTLEFFADAIIPSLDLIGNYTVVGRILIAPIEGSGKFTASVGKTSFKVYQKVKEMPKKDGEIYLEPVVTTTRIAVGNPKVHLEGLFGGNDELNNITNKVISDNIDVLFEELKPVLEKVITHIAEDLLFKAFEGNVPYDRLYPLP